MTNIHVDFTPDPIGQTLNTAYDLVSTIRAVLTDTTADEPNVSRDFLLKCSLLITQQSMLLDGLAVENRTLNHNLATFVERQLAE